MISIIDGSPKKTSNSSYFLSLLTKNLKDDYIVHKLYHEKLDDIINNIKKADTLVIAFPLYVDAPPSKLLELMEKYPNDKNLYIICNCGFLEVKHNDIAVKIIETWSHHHLLGTFKIGAGEVLGNNHLLGKILSPFFRYKMFRFSHAINKHQSISFSSSLLLTKKMYMFFANKSFKKRLQAVDK